MRVCIGTLVIECTLDELDAIVARHGNAVSVEPSVSARSPIAPLGASTATPVTPPSAGDRWKEPTAAQCEQLKEEFGIPDDPSPEDDQRLLAALIQARHHGVLSTSIRRVFGNPYGRGFINSIREFLHRVGLQPNDLVKGGRASSTGHRWRLTDAALTRLGHPIVSAPAAVRDTAAKTCAELALDYIARTPGGVRTSEVARAVDCTLNTTYAAIAHLEARGAVERHKAGAASLWTLPGEPVVERAMTIEAAIIRVLTTANGAPVGHHDLRIGVLSVLRAAGIRVAPESITSVVYRLIARHVVERGGADENGPKYVLAKSGSESEPGPNDEEPGGADRVLN